MRQMLLGSVALCAMCVAPPALSQIVSDAPEGVDETGLADIVVTAQRRQESSQKAAIAIDVVGGDELANAGVVTASSLNAAVPSLYVTRAGGANSSFFIRGVGNFTNNGYSDPAVSFNVDGVYYGRPTSTTGTFYDLDRVEVLKGPQGTLYGRNATGGAINIIPARPKPGEFSGYASAGYGNYDALDLEAAINVPVGENGALRVSGKLVNVDGWNSDGTSDEKGEAFRVQLMGELTDTLTIRASGDYSHTGGVGTGSTFEGRVAYSPGSPATATSPANYTYIPTNFDARSGLHSAEGREYFAGLVLGGPQVNPAPLQYPYQDNRYMGGHIELNWETGAGTLTIIPAYRHSSINNLFNGPAFRGGLIDEDDDQFTVEARFAGKRAGPIDWLIGGFYYDESIRGRYTFSQYTVQAYQTFKTGTTSHAAFGRVTAHLGERLRLVGGIRYTDDKKRFNGGGLNVIQICTVPPPAPSPRCAGGPSLPVALDYADLARILPPALVPMGLPTLPGPANSRPFGASGNRIFTLPIPINQTQKFDKITYRLAGEFDLGENSLLYASYETGYRSGGFSVAFGKETYLPEYITAITIGSKNRFFDDRVQLNIEAFRWKYRDQQVAHFGLDNTNNSAFFSENIGRSTIKGVDFDLQFKAGRHTLLRGSLQYLDNKLDSFIYDTARGGTNLQPVVSCPYTDAVDASSRLVYRVDCSGKPGFNSPKWAGNVGIEQTIELGSHKLVGTFDGRYRSNRVIGFEFLPQMNSGEDFTMDASLTLAQIDDRYAITAWIRNITDEDVPVLAQYAGSTGGTVTTAYGAPRTYGIRARFNF